MCKGDRILKRVPEGLTGWERVRERESFRGLREKEKEGGETETEIEE